jgi:hypothetical protein
MPRLIETFTKPFADLGVKNVLKYFSKVNASNTNKWPYLGPFLTCFSSTKEPSGSHCLHQWD